MSYHFSMGAINKNTNKYEHPNIANKIHKYECPSCKRNVIFKNGKIKKSHFSHNKSENPCNYYDKPNESQKHKHAKLLLKYILDNKSDILFYRFCNDCSIKKNMFKYEITKNDYNENTSTIIEYKFNYNNSHRSADVALIENKNIKYIFEICYKNKTKEENRPEPWFEINSEKLINNINFNNKIEIECIRDYKCNLCIKKIQQREIESIEINERYKKWEEEINRQENELLIMSKQDERTIQRQLLIKKNQEEIKKKQEEINRQKNELLIMSKQDERTIQRQLLIKLEEERKEKLLKEEYEIIKKNQEENIKKIFDKDVKCSICNINFCKCNNPNFKKNIYNKIICINCNKYKCLCIKITKYFL
jgi:hypothetical protein